METSHEVVIEEARAIKSRGEATKMLAIVKTLIVEYLNQTKTIYSWIDKYREAEKILEEKIQATQKIAAADLDADEPNFETSLASALEDEFNPVEI